MYKSQKSVVNSGFNVEYLNFFLIGHPIMPLAVNIHERQFKSSHSLFWARVGKIFKKQYMPLKNRTNICTTSKPVSL